MAEQRESVIANRPGNSNGTHNDTDRSSSNHYGTAVVICIQEDT